MQKFATTDIALATALLSGGNKLIDVKSVGYAQAEFIIEGYDLTNEVILFQNRNYKVDALTLFENHKSLKSRANDAIRNTH